MVETEKSFLDELMENCTAFKIEDGFIKQCRRRYSMNDGQIIGRFFARELSRCIWKEHEDVSYRDEIAQVAKDTRKEILDYKITDIYYHRQQEAVFIQLNRPGLIIGEHGKNIDIIDKHFRDFATKCGIPYKTLKILEDIVPLEDDLLRSVIEWSYSMSDPDY